MLLAVALAVASRGVTARAMGWQWRRQLVRTGYALDALALLLNVLGCSGSRDLEHVVLRWGCFRSYCSGVLGGAVQFFNLGMFRAPGPAPWPSRAYPIKGF